MTEIDNARLTLLSFVIGEWQAAVAHLEAIQRAGCYIDGVTRDTIEDELDALGSQWAAACGWATYETPLDRTIAIGQARHWATTHPSEIEALTGQQEGTEHDATEPTGTRPWSIGGR